METIDALIGLGGMLALFIGGPAVALYLIWLVCKNSEVVTPFKSEQVSAKKLPDYDLRLFEPLTFEEFVHVFELTEEDVAEIESIEVLKSWIDRGIANANTYVSQCRSSYKIADERTNVAFYREFARMMTYVKKPGETGYNGITARLAKRFADWYKRAHGISR